MNNAGMHIMQTVHLHKYVQILNEICHIKTLQMWGFKSLSRISVAWPLVLFGHY